ncbi:MAG: ATP-binding protein [Prolixibacteraceae bacterium]|nr:ATP-binding protein [Prolixibacteraceae bacterium]
MLKEKEISEFKIQKEHELTEKKLAFFTSISHDLKTPLTLIDAPVNDLLNNENLSSEQTNKLQIIKRNSKRLYQLITDLLDFRKITLNHTALEVKETSVSEIIKNAYEAFNEECIKKSVELNLKLNDNIKGFIDAHKIEKVLWNLLSNALKFTNKGGQISIELEIVKVDGNRNINLKVSDNGIGINESEKNKIFDRFYKVPDLKKVNQEGTGIGLSIVKELVEIHHGTIQVESVLGSGTTFIVTIPIDKEAYTENEIAVYDQNAETTEVGDTHNHQTISTKKRYNLQGILIVEDNSELRNYLAEHFEKSFKVYTAADGFEGLNLAKEINPDIILTDVQMPNMNGYEFCNQIRQNFDTSHIPVVMLTANAGIEQQLEGLSTGADSYLTKPFDIRFLDAQINSLLENRRKLRTKFHGIDANENIEMALPQKDIDFIFELKNFIEQNIMNSGLNVELLSEHFTVSVAQLHRKIKSLTDSTPNNIIKSIRLKKAYKLIKVEGLRVSEAAYQTGFSDPNYFTTCFKKEFGKNPSQISKHSRES